MYNNKINLHVDQRHNVGVSDIGISSSHEDFMFSSSYNRVFCQKAFKYLSYCTFTYKES